MKRRPPPTRRIPAGQAVPAPGAATTDGRAEPLEATATGVAVALDELVVPAAELGAGATPEGAVDGESHATKAMTNEIGIPLRTGTGLIALPARELSPAFCRACATAR